MSGKSILGKSIFLLVIIASAALLIVITSLRVTEKREDPILPVNIISAGKGNLARSLQVSGFIESDSVITVLPHISGRLTGLSIEMGDPVVKDQVVATIDREPYELTYNQARAAYLAARSTFNRISSLYSSKSVSQQNYDESKASYDAAKAAFELAELNLSYTEVKSPIDGVVLERHISAGAMAAPQIPIVTIGDLDNLKVNCGIPEIHYSDFLRRRDSMKVLVSVPAMDDKKYEGQISNIAPFISAGSRDFTLLCSILDEEKELRPGMYVTIDFVLEEENDAYYLPYEVLSSGKIWYVKEDGTASSEEFTPPFGNEEFFSIPGNLADRRFIIEGQAFLREGDTVRIIGE